MHCKGCGKEITHNGSYCTKCRNDGVVLSCAYCAKPLVVTTRQYTTALRRKSNLVHKECHADYMREFVWTAEKRASVGNKSASRWKDETYRKKVTEKSTAALRTQEIRKKCSESAKKRFEDSSQRETISNTLKQLYAQPEYKQVVSERMQGFWESDDGARAKSRISASLNEFWTDEQRQLKSEFLQEFYQTEDGIKARKAMSDGKKLLFSSPEGLILRQQISDSLKVYFLDSDNLAKMREAVTDFWQSEEGVRLRKKLNEQLVTLWKSANVDEDGLTLRERQSLTLKEYWKTPEGVAMRTQLTEKQIQLWNSDVLGEDGLTHKERQSKLQQQVWQSDSIAEDGLTHRERMVRFHKSYWQSEEGKQCRAEIVETLKKKWNSSEGLAMRKATSIRMRQFWQSDLGKDILQDKLAQDKVNLALETLTDEKLAIMRLYWVDKTDSELQFLHQTARMQSDFAGFCEAMLWEVKENIGRCTRQDLSRALGIPYNTIKSSCLGILGFDSAKSILQQEVVDFVKTICDSNILEENCPDFLKTGSQRGKELDIYIPEKKLAIEVNGTYWHSEQMGKDKDYHYNKSKLCREVGVRLIHVWEHEWNNPRQRHILESIIKSALGLSKTVYARKLKVEYRKSVEMREFFETNNIQGFRGGEFAVCLVDPITQEVLLAYLLGKGNHFSRGYKYEVIRGACKLGYNIVGGFSKAFKHLFSDHPEIDNLVYYIDYNYFDGKSLQSNSEWVYKSENVSFKNYFVATGEVKNRNPGKHKEITQGYADGSILKLWNAGVASYIYNRK